MLAEWAVLLVEDNRGDAHLVERAFAEADTGARLLEARDGSEALMLVEKADPDMVLLDLGLPDLGGLDLLAYLRSTGRCARSPIVVMTSSSDEADRQAALDSGAERFVTKPSTFEELLAIVKELTAHFRPRR